MYAASHKIRSENVEAFTKKVASFNRRAAKGKIDAGLELIINHEVFEEVFTRGIYGSPDTTEIIPWTWISIIGETPKLNGWELCARYDFERDAEGNPICYSHAVPGIETPEEYWEIDKPYCEHCNERRHRKHSFLVRNEAGEYKIVGRNCLKDFLGNHTSPEHMVNWFTWVRDIEKTIDELYEGLGRGVDRHHYFNLENVLSWTASVTSKVGWMSRAKAYENDSRSTALIVFRHIDPPSYFESEGEKAKWREEHKIFAPNEKHIEVAKRTMELVVEAEDDGEYIYKLKKILDAGVVSAKNRNVWVSAITLYIKDENIKKSPKRPARDVPDVVEGRYEIEGKIESFKEVENTYSPLGGTIIKMIMEDAEGRRYWGTCPACLVECEDSQAEIGSKIKVTVTVEASDRDSKFGFMKRPTKTVLIA